MEFLFLSPFFILILLALEEPEDPYAEKRFEMVENQIISRGIQDRAVVEAMLKVPRHEFVTENLRSSAYQDGPLPIGEGQTISQPYIVALMTELVAPSPSKKILEVGTGSGYQSAVLAESGCELYTIEIVERLAEKARKILEALGYENIKYRIGDGYAGWEEEAPFDGIIVTAAPGKIPENLVDQLKPGARMVIPVGGINQELKLIEKTDDGLEIKNITSVRFVKMTGESEES